MHICSSDEIFLKKIQHVEAKAWELMELKFSFFNKNWISCDFSKDARAKTPWVLVDWGYKHPQNHPKYVVVIQYELWLLDMTLVLNGDIYGVHAILVVGAHGSLAWMG
jgi:hypothetical protein